MSPKFRGIDSTSTSLLTFLSSRGSGQHRQSGGLWNERPTLGPFVCLWEQRVALEGFLGSLVAKRLLDNALLQSLSGEQKLTFPTGGLSSSKAGRPGGTAAHQERPAAGPRGRSGRRLSGVAASPPPPAPVFVLCIQISRGGRRAPSGPPRACSRTPPRVHGTSFSSCLPTAGPTLTEMNIAKTYVALGPREPCRTGLGRGRRPDQNERAPQR